jgi:hypothetical protein
MIGFTNPLKERICELEAEVKKISIEKDILEVGYKRLSINASIPQKPTTLPPSHYGYNDSVPSGSNN